jgi:hypothetical protein
VRHSNWWKPFPHCNRVGAYKTQTSSRNVTTAKYSVMTGLIASNLPVVCGLGAVTCTRSAWKRAIWHRYRHAASASLWTERNVIPLNYRACRHAREEMRKRKSQTAPNTTSGMVSSSSPTTPGLPFWWCYAATHSNSSSLSRPQLHRPARSLEAQPKTSTKSVSSGS